MTPLQQKNEVLRLKRYQEQVTNNLNSAQGELKEFWQRELKKTTAKIARFV